MQWQLDGTKSETTIQPATEPVIVCHDVCRDVASVISRHSIPESREESSLLTFAPRDIGNFYLLLVALCHQTSPRGLSPLEGFVDGRRLRGWDYLSAKLELAAQADLHVLSPEAWSRISPEKIEEIFADDRLGSRLTNPAARSALVRDLGDSMQGNSWRWADDLYQAANGRIAGREPHLVGLLSRFRAYDDPVRKKSFFYLALMQNAGLWVYEDPQNLGAPVDYHEVRGHLRLGTVQVVDPELRAKLIRSSEVTAEEDVSIRRAVYDALMLISELSGLRNANQLHYLFWNVFRSCCTRESPHCEMCPANCSLPARYVPLALRPGGKRRCPFSEVCQSSGETQKLVEHVVDTDYY